MSTRTIRGVRDGVARWIAVGFGIGLALDALIVTAAAWLGVLP